MREYSKKKKSGGKCMKKIYGLIRKLGANSKYKGYFFTADAIRMTMTYQEKPLRITKDIYRIWLKSINPHLPM